MGAPETMGSWDHEVYRDLWAPTGAFWRGSQREKNGIRPVRSLKKYPVADMVTLEEDAALLTALVLNVVALVHA